MDYLEQLVLKSWEKIPEDFKRKASILQLVVKESQKEDLNLISDRIGTTVIIYKVALRKRFQSTIDRLLIKELSQIFDFTEEEAKQIMGKNPEL